MRPGSTEARAARYAAQGGDGSEVDADAPQWTLNDVAKATPDAIAQALRDGQLADLLAKADIESPAD